MNVIIAFLALLKRSDKGLKNSGCSAMSTSTGSYATHKTGIVEVRVRISVQA